MFFKNAFKIQLSTYKTPSVSRYFPGSSDSNESGCNVGDLGSIPGLGRSPGEGNGYPLRYSSLENAMDIPGRPQSIGLQRVGHDEDIDVQTSWYH